MNSPSTLARLALGLSVITSACDSSTGSEAGPSDASVIDASDAAPDADPSDADPGDADPGDAASPPIEPDVACDLPGVRSFVAPATSDLDGPRLRLRYRVFESRRAAAPTVIVVPGGPGQALMADDAARSFALGSVPLSDFRVVYVDARGAGCNHLPKLDAPDAEVFSIDRVAEDLVALIQAEAQSDYFLFGASFGTTAVTVAAQRLEARGLPLPRRVVLEGVVGRSFTSFAEYFAPFGADWRRVEPMLPATWRAELTTEPFSGPLGYTRQQWGAFVSAQLILGDYPGQGHLLSYWLQGLDAGSAAAVDYVQGFMSQIPGDTPSGPPDSLFRSIACRELWGSWQSDRELRDGELRALGEDACSGEPRTPYDAAEHPARVPFVYFHGPFDPTTTTAQAEHHFTRPGTGRRDLVTVPDAAHAPLTLGLTARGCAPQVWSAIAGADGALAPVLQACARPGETIELRTRD